MCELTKDDVMSLARDPETAPPMIPATRELLQDWVGTVTIGGEVVIWFGPTATLIDPDTMEAVSVPGFHEVGGLTHQQAIEPIRVVWAGRESHVYLDISVEENLWRWGSVRLGGADVHAHDNVLTADGHTNLELPHDRSAIKWSTRIAWLAWLAEVVR